MRNLTRTVAMAAVFGLLMVGCKSAEEKAADKAKADKEFAQLEGKWTLTEFLGNATDPEESKDDEPAAKKAGETGITFTFKDDLLEVKYGNRPEYYVLTLSPDKDPKRVDMLLVEENRKAIQKTVWERGFGKKKEWKERKRDDKRLGVYKVDGDKLTICFAYGGKDRPDGFSAPGGTNRVLWTLKKTGGSKKPAAEKDKAEEKDKAKADEKDKAKADEKPKADEKDKAKE